jgi:4-hydroxybenzoate polyprenyltransferase
MLALARMLGSDTALALRALRAPQWVWFLLLPLAGFDRLDGARLALAVACAAGALGWAYGVNAVAERHTDRSARKNPLAGLAVLPRATWLVLLGALALALVAARGLGPLALGAVTLSVLAGTLYSVGPRLKSWPGAGLVANTLIFTPLPVLGALRGALPPAFAVTTVTFVALLVQNQLAHELADAAEDEAAGAHTTARALGEDTTRRLLAGLAVAGAVLCAVVPGPRHLVPTSAAVLAAATASLFLAPDWAIRRRAHRLVSLLGGAALFAAGLR